MEFRATIAELCTVAGQRTAYVGCAAAAIPAPGRYVLAHGTASDAPVATELFAAEYRSDGFVAAPPVPSEWSPGSEIDIRGPLGKGFEIPPGSRRVALIAFDGDATRLLPLIAPAIRQEAGVALVCAEPASDLPLQLEIHPLRALAEVCAWSDYAAFDVTRGSMVALEGALMRKDQLLLVGSAEVLIRVPMPCGGIAECGVCTVRTARGPSLACVDGPVFDLRLLLGKS